MKITKTLNIPDGPKCWSCQFSSVHFFDNGDYRVNCHLYHQYVDNQDKCRLCLDDQEKVKSGQYK